jgi:hypothetical protein
MLAGTTGSGVAPLAAPCSAGPALIMRQRQRGRRSSAAWVNHSLRDMNPLLMTGFVGRLHNPFGSSRPSVRERSEHDYQ